MMEYQKIDLNEYVRTGEGGTAVSYTKKTRNTLAKLYNPGFEADRAKQEFLIASSVFNLGIPTPEPIRLVTDGERFGAEYELISGKRSFARIISQEPERLEEISLEFARLTRKLHGTKADTTKISSYKQRMQRFYMEKSLVPDEYKRRALAFLEQVPDTPTCVHGDLHIGNIITDGKRTLWIDVGEFGYGVPEWDLSLMWTICNNMSNERANELFHVTHDTLFTHWNIFLTAYLGTSDRQVLGEFTKRLLSFYAVKLPYVFDMSSHTSLLETVLQKVIHMLP